LETLCKKKIFGHYCLIFISHFHRLHRLIFVLVFLLLSLDFKNLQNNRILRALSCESITSQASVNMSGPMFRSSSEQKLDVTDAKAWLKNPVDFITLPCDKYRRQESETEDSTAIDMERGPFVAGPAILISMSYMPTAERLGIIIVKVRLNFENECEKPNFTRIPKQIYVKAYLIDEESGRRMSKKKTSLKPVGLFQNVAMINFNELMIFPLPINLLSRTGIRISVTGIGSFFLDKYYI